MFWQRQAGIWLAPLCMFISLCLLTGICQAAPSHVAEIIGINGQVESRIGGGSFSPAAILQKLASRDAARTLVNSKAELSFIDKSIMVLGPQTTMEISQYRLGEREAGPSRALKVLNGKARFIVNKFTGTGTGDPEFTVETPTMGVGIRGTDGVVEVKGTTDYVYLLQARVPLLLRNKTTGEQMDLKPGFFVVSQANRPFRTFPLTDELRRSLLRELSLAFEVRPLGVTVDADLPLEQPSRLGPPAGPTQALPPVYTPPVPATPQPTAPYHSHSPSP